MKKNLQSLFLILKDKEGNKFSSCFPVKTLEETKKFYEERYAAKNAELQDYAYAISLKKIITLLVSSISILKILMILVMNSIKNFDIKGFLMKFGKQLLIK